MTMKTIMLNEERKVSLSIFLQPVSGEFANIAKRPAILILPGGGYTTCSDREAEPAAYPYLAAGYQVFILRYSVKKDAVWPHPLDDYEQAMELIRSKADAWNVFPDKIAVIGFSAGGHLAGCAAAMARNRPNAAILGYAALDGQTISSYHPSAPDVISKVDEHTCPCFVFSSRTDNMVPIRNSTRFLHALAEHDVSFESHIYAYGPHGFSVANASVLTPGTELCPRIPRWVEDSIAWLEELFGKFDENGLSAPKFKDRVNGNHDACLNADCTVAYLSKFEAAKPIMDSILQAGTQSYADYFPDEAAPDEPRMAADTLYETMTLRDILGYGGVAQEAISQIDAALRLIPNT